MPIAMLQELPPEVTPELFDAVSAKLDSENNPPKGLIVHTAGRRPDGGFRVFDVWESREAMERFEQERLVPAIEEVAQGGAPPRPEQFIYELHEVVSP
jgi:hypothetical protein